MAYIPNLQIKNHQTMEDYFIPGCRNKYKRDISLKQILMQEKSLICPSGPGEDRSDKTQCAEMNLKIV